jgi:hypothetical protein
MRFQIGNMKHTNLFPNQHAVLIELFPNDDEARAFLRKNDTKSLGVHLELPIANNPSEDEVRSREAFSLYETLSQAIQSVQITA